MPQEPKEIPDYVFRRTASTVGRTSRIWNCSASTVCVSALRLPHEDQRPCSASVSCSMTGSFTGSGMRWWRAPTRITSSAMRRSWTRRNMATGMHEAWSSSGWGLIMGLPWHRHRGDGLPLHDGQHGHGAGRHGFARLIEHGGPSGTCRCSSAAPAAAPACRRASVSLMQMAKTSSGAQALSASMAAFISACSTRPTTGGVRRQLCDAGRCDPGGAGRPGAVRRPPRHREDRSTRVLPPRVPACGVRHGEGLCRPDRRAQGTCVRTVADLILLHGGKRV